MRLNPYAIQDTGWEQLLKELQTICKSHNAPTFSVAGPRMLPALSKLGGLNAQRTPTAFIGGENFRPSQLVTEKLLQTDEILVSIVLNPTDLKQVKRINNVRLPLAEAFEAFEGLERWVATIVPSLKASTPLGAPDAPVVTVEQKRGSDEWGAW